MRCREHHKENCRILITCRLDAIMDTQAVILEKLQHIERNERKELKLMSTIDEALKTIDDETNVIADEQTKLGARVEKLIASVTAGKNLTPAQQAELDAINARHVALADALRGMAKDADNPVPTPVEPA